MSYGDIALTTQVLASSSSAAGAVTTTLVVAANTNGPLNRYIMCYAGAQAGANAGTVTLKELASTLDVVTIYSSSGQHIVLIAPIKTAASNSCTLVVAGNGTAYASVQFAYV